MTRFMLDTDSISLALRGQGQVGARIVQHLPSELCVSAITMAELRYGADRRSSRKIHRAVDSFIKGIEVMPFDDQCATQFGRLASELADAGTPIGDFDVLIAAHAIAVDAILVTSNTKHFARVRSLRSENWF